MENWTDHNHLRPSKKVVENATYLACLESAPCLVQLSSGVCSDLTDAVPVKDTTGGHENKLKVLMLACSEWRVQFVTGASRAVLSAMLLSVVFPVVHLSDEASRGLINVSAE